MTTEDVKNYYPLGQKTLVMCILKKSAIFFIFLAILFIGLFFLDNVSREYFDTAVKVIIAYVSFMLFSGLLVFFLGWLQYYRYGISIGQKHLQITRGLISIEQIGVPYKRIRDVKIKRNLIDQFLDTSDIVVALSDFEDENSSSDQSLIFLPSLDQKIATEIRDNILARSQVEQINIVNH